MFSGARNPEPALAAAVILLSVVLSIAGGRCGWLGWWERPLARLARRRKRAILVSALVPMALRAALLPLFPVPAPQIHDEFSFLFAADTLTHGRLANPPHPFWAHFETMHILAHPMYVSAFPIAQGFALAAGRWIFGNPWAGVWLSGGILCGTICWMLQGWLPARWALLGALLVTLRIGVSSYWMNSYWGGFVPAIGGALLLGALPRVMRGPRWAHALIMGAGFSILAHSRSFEGAVFGLGVSAPLLVWLGRRKGKDRTAALRQFVVPLAAALAVLAAGTGYYFWRATGKPWLPPYVLYRDSMTVVPHFVFEKPTPAPLYNNRPMWDFYVNWEMLSYLASMHTAQDVWIKTQAYWRFYIGPLLTIPLLGVFFLRKRLRWLLWLAAFFAVAALLFQVWHNLHYAAPATGLAILLIVLGLRRLRMWRAAGRPLGLILARAIPVACAAMLVLQIVAGPAPVSQSSETGWRWPRAGCTGRVQIARQLQATGGKHLVFVRYSPVYHDPGIEWVYNEADIDNAPVVWARELDAPDNQSLMRYFQHRQVWVVEPDSVPDCQTAPRLIPYDDAPAVLMPYVTVGAPGIATLRSPERVRSRVLSAGRKRNPGARLTCDQWNYLFAEETGVAGPDITRDCYGKQRGDAVPFEKWWAYLQQQPKPTW